MIKLENTEVVGFGAAIRGMRNPKNSWDKMDTAPCATSEYTVEHCADCEYINLCNAYEGDLERNYILGPNDLELATKLAKGGPVHAKYRRMMGVYVDITAPLFWWKEFDTYKVGTVANSCSTMHKIHDAPFGVHNFTLDTLLRGNLAKADGELVEPSLKAHYKHFTNVISSLNNLRDLYLKTNDKKYWRSMIEMLPSSYNQKRTILLNYEVLHNIYFSRRDHKLTEWHKFCNWIESLPYSELITTPETKMVRDMTEEEMIEKLTIAGYLVEKMENNENGKDKVSE